MTDSRTSSSRPEDYEPRQGARFEVHVEKSRIFNWEAVRPTAVYRKLMSEEAAPFMALVVEAVGKRIC